MSMKIIMVNDMIMMMDIIALSQVRANFQPHK